MTRSNPEASTNDGQLKQRQSLNRGRMRVFMVRTDVEMIHRFNLHRASGSLAFLRSSDRAITSNDSQAFYQIIAPTPRART